MVVRKLRSESLWRTCHSRAGTSSCPVLLLSDFKLRRLLRLMRVLGSAVDFQFLGHVFAQLVLGKHAADGNLDHTLREALHQGFIRLTLLPAGIVDVR